jgi:hypothetical protein
MKRNVLKEKQDIKMPLKKINWSVLYKMHNYHIKIRCLIDV